MSTDHWMDDDRPPPPRRRRWPVVVLVLLLLVAVGAVVLGVFPETLVGKWYDWQLRRFRNDIISGRLSPEELRDELVRRDDGLYLAVRLSEDPDPRVRAAAIDRFVAGTNPARRREPGDGPPGGGLESAGEEALKRLLADPDPTVRKKAIRAVSGIAVASRFEGPLLRILESGSREERLIVCEYLAHWNGAAVRNTFADAKQPKEVRLAALRSTEQFGWAEVVTPRGKFVAAMKQVAADPDPELRQAALDALARVAGK